MISPATFFKNTSIGDQITALRVAVINLSVEGYIVLEARSSSQKEVASVIIDKPFDCRDAEIEFSDDKAFAYVNRWECRIGWRI